jgi:transcription elongation GreA/GreB family factor
MDKSQLHARIIATLETDRQTAMAALRAAHEAATDEESKAENKYDTRGLEAAYLADGQSRRLQEIELALAAYRQLTVTAQGGGIRVGALVLLASTSGERRFFLGPDAAGLKVAQAGEEVLVISPRSPLGQGLLGKVVGDEVEVRVNGAVQLYEVLEVG